MADITPLFKASIKTVRTRNKALGLGKENGKTSILSVSHSKQKSDFSQKTKEVVSSVTKLRDFLLKHQKDYINASSHLSSSANLMSDSERDQIDHDAQEIIKTCSDSIRLIKSEARRQRVTQQVQTHREAVLDLLDAYLKGVCKIYSEQRAIRVKRVVDKKRISRLQLEQLHMSNPGMTATERRSQRRGNDDRSGEAAGSSDSQNQTEANQAALDEAAERNKLDYDEEFSPEEMAAFEQENRTLFTEMTNLVDEVRQIEGKVVEITKLQEVFAEKVLSQSTDIDRIAETAVKTTENIKQGNEDVRQAIKNTASLRVWILFFLVMCSFSLLFLDWYS